MRILIFYLLGSSIMVCGCFLVMFDGCFGYWLLRTADLGSLHFLIAEFFFLRGHFNPEVAYMCESDNESCRYHYSRIDDMAHFKSESYIIAVIAIPQISVVDPRCKARGW